MGIVIYKRVHFTSLGTATSMAAASAIRRLAAACGLVLLSRVPARTACITIVAMSSRPTTLTVTADFQSAVSLNIFHIIIKKKNQDMCLFFFSYYSFFVGLSFAKESPS